MAKKSGASLLVWEFGFVCNRFWCVCALCHFFVPRVFPPTPPLYLNLVVEIHFITHLFYTINAKMIMASNDINEAVLHSLAEQDHSIDAFGECVVVA